MVLQIIGSVLAILAPLIISLSKFLIKNKAKRDKFISDFYRYIEKIDDKKASKIEKYIAAEDSLKELQNEIREKRLEEPTRYPLSKRGIPKYDIPQIEVVDIKVETHGKYLTDSERAMGLVVHYTGGSYSRGRQNAINTLQHLAGQGYSCLVMDTAGKIYRAKDQKLDDIGWHVGPSYWLGRKGLSRYLMGMEICCAGKLKSNGLSWFGQVIPKKFTRAVKPNVGHRKEGVYHKFTQEQEKSLINFVLWQLDINPEFNINWVVGHDEVSSERKSDPGGSLSMTMPEFRAMIKKRLKNMSI